VSVWIQSAVPKIPHQLRQDSGDNYLKTNSF
jgi:hypothetical protein